MVVAGPDAEESCKESRRWGYCRETADVDTLESQMRTKKLAAGFERERAEYTK